MWLFAVFTAVLDQLSKAVADYLCAAGRMPVPLVPGVLQLIEHPGNVRGIFGQGPQGVFFYVLATLAGLAVVGVFFMTTPAGDAVAHAALGMLAGGAVGNLVDRLAEGRVRDFIDLHWGNAFHWYTFNVADAAICVGFALMLYVSVFPRRQARLERQG